MVGILRVDRTATTNSDFVISFNALCFSLRLCESLPVTLVQSQLTTQSAVAHCLSKEEQSAHAAVPVLDNELQRRRVQVALHVEHKHLRYGRHHLHA